MNALHCVVIVYYDGALPVKGSPSHLCLKIVYVLVFQAMTLSVILEFQQVLTSIWSV